MFFGCDELPAYADGRKCKLTVYVTNGTRNELLQPETFVEPKFGLVECAVVFRRWSKESLNAELGVTKDDHDNVEKNERESQISFAGTSPLNFAIVDHGMTFVLNFDTLDARWAVIPTLIGTPPNAVKRTDSGMASAKFICSAKAGVHDVVCLNSNEATIGHVMAVPKFADEYEVVANGSEIEFEFGRADVAIWLGDHWHPMRFSSAVAQTELILHFHAVDQK